MRTRATFKKRAGIRTLVQSDPEHAIGFMNAVANGIPATYVLEVLKAGLRATIRRKIKVEDNSGDGVMKSTWEYGPEEPDWTTRLRAAALYLEYQRYRTEYAIGKPTERLEITDNSPKQTPDEVREKTLASPVMIVGIIKELMQVAQSDPAVNAALLKMLGDVDAVKELNGSEN